MATARLLVVDDDPAVLRLTSKMLGSRYEVVAASGPLKAIDFARAGRFDLVLSDFEMPEMQGPELLAAIHGFSPSTAALLMSGNSDLSTIPDGIKLIKKPFTSEELHAAVEDVLASSHQLGADLARKREHTTTLLEKAQRIKLDLDKTLQESIRARNHSLKLRNPVPDHPAQKAPEYLCIFCAEALPADSQLCHRCGKPVGPYVIVRDGQKVGIFCNGEVRIHGLSLERAKALAFLLNTIAGV